MIVSNPVIGPDLYCEVGQRGGDTSRCGWFKADVIVDCISEPLFAAKVSLGRLDAQVTKQELDLLKFSACLVTQARARSTLMPHAA